MGINRPVRKRHLGIRTWQRSDKKAGIVWVRSRFDHRRRETGLKSTPDQNNVRSALVTQEPTSGSTSAQLRNAFIDLIEEDSEGEEACRLAAQLAACTDVLPVEYCELLGLAPGSTFAQAARKVRVTLGCVGSG